MTTLAALIGDAIRSALDSNHVKLSPILERRVIADAIEHITVAGYELTLLGQTPGMSALLIAGWRGDPADIVAASERDPTAFLRRIAAATPQWHAEAACSDTDRAVFFPARGESTAAARAICADCPVRQPCLDEAVNDPDLDHGIRGGLPPRARQHLRRTRRSITETAQ